MIWIRSGVPCDSIRLAVFTASPQRSYRNRLRPMTPATTGPELMPMRSSRPRSPTAPPGAIAATMSSASSGQGSRVVRPGVGNARGDHVGVADGLDLLEPVRSREVVEVAEEAIEQPDDLRGRKALGAWGEVDDVGEEDGCGRELVGDRLGVRPSAAPRWTPAGC